LKANQVPTLTNLNLILI